MVFRKSLILLLLFIFVIPGPTLAFSPADDPAWQQITPGIEYQKFQLLDPNNVYVVRMDRNNPDVTLESTIAQGTLAQGRETVSGMYTRYDQALNYWGGSATPTTWGMRSQAIVAINGSYFDYNTGIPQGGMVQSGWYAKRYDNLGGWSGFAWRLDRTPFIGECVDHNPEKQLITFDLTGNTQLISNVNTKRGTNQLILYTPQYNSQTGTDNSGVEVIVEMARPTMILPNPVNALGYVRQIRNNAGNSYIPFNSIILSASGSAAQTLLQNVQVGSGIHVSQEITSYDADCVTPNSLSWTKTYASVQGAFYFLKNGVIRDFDDPGATERNPRTAIAYNGQYIYYVVVDGRDRHHSVGMTIHELAVFVQDTLGATYAVAQDGGGSSTMVINGLVVNNSYCNIYSCNWQYATYLPLVNRRVNTGQSPQSIQPDIIRSPAGIERAVANGMLMISVLPPAYSATFTAGELVTTTVDAPLRLGPGTNYASLSTIASGTHGTILEQMNGLNGVLAKSANWWFVDFAGVHGWMAESALLNRYVWP